MKKCIHIVKSVDRIPYTAVQRIILHGKRVVKLETSEEWERMEVRPHPSLQIATKEDDKATIWTATLKFFTPEFTGAHHRHYMWRVGLTSGRTYILGTDHRPFATQQVQTVAPEKPSDNQWDEVTVTYQDARAVPILP